MSEFKEYTLPVLALVTLGECHEGMQNWLDYPAQFGLTNNDVDELIRLAQDDELFWRDTDSLEVWAGIHAWRALAQLGDLRAIKPLIRLLLRQHPDNDFIDDWTSEDLPRALAHFGAAAVAPLGAFLADPQHGIWPRVAASSTLEYIGLKHPETRDACVELLAQRLEKHAKQPPELNASLIASMAELKAVERADVMEAAFAAEDVDLSVMGDWEEVQIRLGLLTERITPPPRYGWLGEDFSPLAQLDRLMGRHPDTAPKDEAKAAAEAAKKETRRLQQAHNKAKKQKQKNKRKRR